MFEGGQVYSVKRDVDPSLCFAAVVPDYKLLTEAARAALPAQVPHKDAGVQFVPGGPAARGFLRWTGMTCCPSPPKTACTSPTASPLMPGSKEVFALAKQCGALAVYVSGAGSTVMAVAERSSAESLLCRDGTGTGSPGGPGRM